MRLVAQPINQILVGAQGEIRMTLPSETLKPLEPGIRSSVSHQRQRRLQFHAMSHGPESVLPLPSLIGPNTVRYNTVSGVVVDEPNLPLCLV